MNRLTRRLAPLAAVAALLPLAAAPPVAAAKFDAPAALAKGHEMASYIVNNQPGPLWPHVGERMRAFPASGEINRRVGDAPGVIARVEEKYTPNAVAVDRTDGLSVEFAKWRFNLRSSNTEPLLRLNVESRGNELLMRDKTQELLALIGGEPG